MLFQVTNYKQFKFVLDKAMFFYCYLLFIIEEKI